MKKYVFLLLAFLVFFNTQSQIITPEVKQRAESILQKMTLEEKIDYISGTRLTNPETQKTFPGIKPNERLGLPFIIMSDGPQGIRNETKSTLYPCGILSASTWNRDLAKKLGIGLGMDARARGAHILLGPGVNIYRAPMNGRNFEYFGEDPYLTGETAANYIEGVQAQGVIATIKHFAANNQEWDRLNTSSDVDERTLHEIYLPAFEKAVKKAKVGAVMNSYNLLNGVHTTENKDLNINILRNQWNFEGILMSDWWQAVYSTLGPANGGLDLEMPVGKYFAKNKLLPLIQDGFVTEETINTKVRHILETIIAFGFLDRTQEDKQIPLDNPYSRQTALELAREGVVLLKNNDNVLPIRENENVLVLGPNANVCPSGGGSGSVSPFSSTTLVEGMQSLMQTNQFTFKEILMSSNIAASNEFFVDNSFNETGFKCEYFNTESLCGKPTVSEVVQAINFNWLNNSPAKGINSDNFSVRYTTVFRPQKDAFVIFKIGGKNGGFRMYIDDKLFISNWTNEPTRNSQNSFRVEGGKEYAIKIEYYNTTGPANVKLLCDKIALEGVDWIDSLPKADKVVLSVGFDGSIEGEGKDRPFAIPYWQEELIDLVSAYNQNIVVVLNAGGGVDFSKWGNKVKSILMAWYPGQEGGQAIAEILLGKISPSGKLPISIEKKWEDNPVHDSYYADDETAVNKKVTYKEGVFSGYRGYDYYNIEPQFPFGFGLSYSTFNYNNFSINKTGTATYMLSFDITNTGNCDAAEIAQVYVGFPQSSITMPPKMLKQYSKVLLKKGETKTVNILLDQEAFSVYNVNVHQFEIQPGTVEVMVGKSSRDILWKKQITL
jgi:beta-glucosidase